MNILSLPLVNWGMGAILLGVFLVVIVIMFLVIYAMANEKSKHND